jgi:hypothetical protein
MNGNFCTVEMMIFLPSAMNLRRPPECSACPTVAPHLRELLDRVADLLVEDTPVGDHDDRVEDRRVVLSEADQLVREPRDGVRLAAARRVLDEISSACAVRLGVREELAHHVELVEARPDLHALLLAGLRILDLDDLRIVFEDVSADFPRLNRIDGRLVQWIMPGIFCGAGALITLLGGFVVLRAKSGARFERRLREQGLTAEARIVDVAPTAYSVNRVRQWRVRYCYTDHAGVEHEGRSPPLAPEQAQRWSAGDRIQVRFDRLHPARSAWRVEP